MLGLGPHFPSHSHRGFPDFPPESRGAGAVPGWAFLLYVGRCTPPVSLLLPFLLCSNLIFCSFSLSPILLCSRRVDPSLRHGSTRSTFLFPSCTLILNRLPFLILCPPFDSYPSTRGGSQSLHHTTAFSQGTSEGSNLSGCASIPFASLLTGNSHSQQYLTLSRTIRGPTPTRQSSSAAPSSS
jgi:hypothetical protein